MGTIALGLTLGLLVGLIVMGCFGLAADASYRNRNLLMTIGIILFVACVVIGTVVAGNLEVHANNAFIEEYEITKEVIDTSVINESLSGFERVELVKQATEINAELVKKQYDSQQWYGFLIPDKILELEPITFGVE